MSANKLIAHTQEILSLGPKGRDCTELAKRYNVCYVTMWKFLTKHGVQFNRESLTDDEQKSMLEEYASGTRTAALGKKYGVTRLTIRNYILRHKVEMLPQYRKSSINHDFFKILTVDSLWALGWFYTDGNISKMSNGFSVTVQRDGEEVLTKLRDVMGIDADAIYRPKNRNVCVFYGCDNSVHSDLKTLGCMPRKSLVIRYPVQLTEPWQHWAFLRGVWEGDGHIGLKGDSNRPGFTAHLASGSRPFIDSVKATLKTYLGIETSLVIVPKCDREIGENVAHFSESYQLFILGGKEVIMRFLDLIYENGNAKHYLDRKFKTYLEMREIMTRPHDRASINRYKHVEVYFMSPDKTVYHVKGIDPFAREMGIKENMLRKMIKGSRPKSGWSLPTPAQIESARSSGTLIEKFY